jgi:hypothetical protein
MKKPTDQHRAGGHSADRDTAKSGLAQAARKWFAFDRRRVVEQIDAMKTSARRHADELEMIGHEGLFRPALCRRFLILAKLYLRLLPELMSLREIVARAKAYPPREKPV